MSDPEELARRWHDDHIDELDHCYSSCWCCCITCDHVNPHYNAAVEALRAALIR
jgi:hypothetical protein